MIARSTLDMNWRVLFQYDTQRRIVLIPNQQRGVDCNVPSNGYALLNMKSMRKMHLPMVILKFRLRMEQAGTTLNLALWSR